jgi:hypothetical protein
LGWLSAAVGESGLIVHASRRLKAGPWKPGPAERPLSPPIAAVIALGVNHRLGRLARSTPFSYRQLAWAADWHGREHTTRVAPIELDRGSRGSPKRAACIAIQPTSSAWPTETKVCVPIQGSSNAAMVLSNLTDFSNANSPDETLSENVGS